MNALVKAVKKAARSADDEEDLAYDLASLLDDHGEDAFCEAIASCIYELMAHDKEDDDDGTY
ncbi:hypothetical protein [Mesorhizobium sp. DCY119]|uniref:hypothetical protein n=1 Tax=Mesorhizobium sp. DCY119 TaxID=2108445 RepID=UPI000E6B8D6D|nr:hypothetical protein [Mesorhizobium sp. DCY119]RJG45869.1 hypothetical protein D3Y55_17500 [Mesorhizobium sp. DCY119]